MEDWDADLSPCNVEVVSPCNFATIRLTAYILSVIYLELRDP